MYFQFQFSLDDYVFVTLQPYCQH